MLAIELRCRWPDGCGGPRALQSHSIAVVAIHAIVGFLAAKLLLPKDGTVLLSDDRRMTKPY